MRGETFVLTSLQDQSFGTTVAFFFSDELVLCSLDVFQALFLMFEPEPRRAGVAAFCAAMRARAERVVVIPDREVASVRVTRRMMQSQLFIRHERGGVRALGYRAVHRPAPAVYRYQLLERDEAEAAIPRLDHRFGARFELVTTRAYAFAHRLAPRLAG
jgi:hypothetical protein